MQAAAGQLEGLEPLARLPEQDQAADLPRGWDHQGRDHPRIPLDHGGQFRLVALAPPVVGQQIGAFPQELGPGLEGFLGESVLRRSIQPLLKGAENALGIDGRTDAQKAKVVDRQFQPKPLSAARL